MLMYIDHAVSILLYISLRICLDLVYINKVIMNVHQVFHPTG